MAAAHLWFIEDGVYASPLSLYALVECLVVENSSGTVNVFANTSALQEDIAKAMSLEVEA